MSQVLTLFELTGDLVQLLCKLSHLYIDLEVPDLLAHLQKLHDVRRVPLDGLDSHVVVHALLHEGSVRKSLSIIRDIKGVQFREVWQMIENICLVVTKVTNGIFSVVRILKSADSQLREPIKVQDFLKVPNLIVRNIELL